MTKPKPLSEVERNLIHLKELSDLSKGYLAGLLDGEGTVSLTRSRDGRARAGFCFRPQVSISTTDEGLINKLRELLGTGFCVSTKPVGLKTQYQFLVCRLVDILALLEFLYPLLVVKQKRAELLMEHCQSRLSKGRMSPYSQREIGIYWEMKALNHNGSGRHPNETSQEKAA